MKMGVNLLKFIQPEYESERMEYRKSLAEAETSSIDLHMTVTENYDELVTALRAAFERAEEGRP